MVSGFSHLKYTEGVRLPFLWRSWSVATKVLVVGKSDALRRTPVESQVLQKALLLCHR